MILHGIFIKILTLQYEERMIFVATPVVSLRNKSHESVQQHLPLTTVNVTTHRDKTNVPETKIHASYHHRNVTEYVIKAIIFALFGIAVVLLLTIFYVYIRQKMHEARSF